VKFFIIYAVPRRITGIHDESQHLSLYGIVFVLVALLRHAGEKPNTLEATLNCLGRVGASAHLRVIKTRIPSMMNRYWQFTLLALLSSTTWVWGQGTGEVRFTRFSFENGGIRLAWQGPTNVAFTLQHQDTLRDGIWRVPALYPLPGNTNEWSDPSGSNSSAFYRLVQVDSARRGELLSVSNRGTLPKALLAGVLASQQIPITPLYNVRLYKLVYETVDPLGAITKASGALLLPENPAALLPLVSYQHGTLMLTNAAPSSMNLQGEAMIGIALASVGYAAVVPDYLGLGDSPGPHPYHHARSEATACVDMLRASRFFCGTNNVGLTNKLFLCGYSQGGHATLALLKELETFHTDEFEVTACAAMAGAYDLSGTTSASFLTNSAPPNPYYFLYLLASYQQVYGLAPTLASLLVAPYDASLPPLLGGNYDGGQINSALPDNPTEILKPEYLESFKTDLRNPLRLALLHNDLINWRPRAALRLYHCPEDDDVAFANSLVAYASFQALGATQVELIVPLANGDHATCAQPSLLLAKAWFDSLR
jgi:pimeloyl-ACP methyl ester carboxylesterase